MRKKVMKWNYSIFDTEIQDTIYSVDYNYSHEDYMRAVRRMISDRKKNKFPHCILKLHKKIRIVEVPTPGISHIKKILEIIKSRPV